mmetsp:Transcript_2999/g.9041  ORF Transcript_2999/g.9041 Transcript_2999/m.9041 type:complete len:329 (+) Transcript_2999:568-1554(+)
MLHACPTVLLQVGLNLALPLRAKSRLIDWEQDHLVVAGGHNTVQSRIDGPNILRCELRELMEACRGDQIVVHLQHVWNVANTVVKPLQSISELRALHGGVPWEEGALVVTTHEPEVDIAVKQNLRDDHLPAGLALVCGLQHMRLNPSFRPVLDGLVVGKPRVRDRDTDSFHSQAMLLEELEGALRVEAGVGRVASFGLVLPLRLVGSVRRGKGERELTTLQDIARVGVVSGRVVGLGDELHAKARREPPVRVIRVAAVQLDVVELLDIEAVRLGVHPLKVRRSHELFFGLDDPGVTLASSSAHGKSFFQAVSLSFSAVLFACLAAASA